MIQNNPVQGPNPYYSYPTQSTNAAQPVAQVNAYANSDRVQMQYRPQQPGRPQQQEQKFSFLTSSDMKLGLMGAVGGFFAAGLIGVSGPIGALIFGVALLGLSIAMRGFKHMSAKKQQQAMPQQAVHPQFQQQAYNPLTYNANSQYQNNYNYQYQQQPQRPAQANSPQYAQQPQNNGMPMQHQQYYNNQTRSIPDQNKSFLEKILYAL